MSVLPLLLNLADELSNLQMELHGPYYSYPDKRRIVPRGAYFSRHGQEKSKKDSLVGKDGFQVSVDVQQFKPKEISVKTVDNTVVVEGKHEEREDEHGFISRHFVRRYALPEGYDSKEVVSTLSSDGLLTITVPKPVKAGSNERIVQIQQTGPAHLAVKDNPKDDKKDSKGKK